MSRTLAILGRFAARRPLVAIIAWVVLAALVISTAAMFGRELDDAFTVPGTDSQRATELLEASGSGAAGLTAQVVVTPRDDATFEAGGPALAAARELRDDLVRHSPRSWPPPIPPEPCRRTGGSRSSACSTR